MPQDAAPTLRVERGDPTDAELAALLAALLSSRTAATAAASSAPRPARPRSLWLDRSRALRGPLAVRPNGWRAAVAPR